MGITAWAAKYQLPNALPTEACEWEETAPAVTPPRERLQALLDDAPAPRSQTAKSQTAERQPPDEAIASPAAVRALLDAEPQGAAKQPAAQPASPSTETAAPAKPLKFSLGCVCLAGRWLVLQAGEMSPLEQQLLGNLLQAAGIQQGPLPSVTHFTWPQMANAFVEEDPLDEAREGLAAFVAGSESRQGWQLERLLWWGELGPDQSPLDRILNVTDGQSQTLSLPVWQGPALASLLEGTHRKRDFWPALQALGQQWMEVGSTGERPVGARQTIDDH